MGVEIDGEGLLPAFERERFNRADGACDAGIIDEDIHAAKRGDCGVEPSVEGGLVGYVADCGGDVFVQRGLRDVAEMDLRTFARIGSRDGPANAGSACGDEDAGQRWGPAFAGMTVKNTLSIPRRRETSFRFICISVSPQ